MVSDASDIRSVLRGFEPGELVAGRYAVQELLGKGDMGAVYRADDRALGEEIALKALLLDDALEAARFRDEVRLARRVSHPNVARVHDVGEHRGVLYLTMELIDGGTLRSLLQAERSLDPRRAVAITRAVCAGLSAAHAAGIVHRDLKPANVLLDRRGRVALADFGIAGRHGGGALRAAAASDAVLEALQSTVCGTPGYIAPEVLAGRPADARADLYALGVVLFVILGGGRPAEASLDPRASLAAAGVPAPLIEVIERCLAIDPEARPASADDLSLLLEAAIAARSDHPDRDRSSGRASFPSLASIADLAPATAPALPGSRRAIAVLPFRYAGPPGLAYLGEALADELVGDLARASGVRVLGTAATARFGEDRDPRALGRALGALVAVDGSAHLAAGRAHLEARLLDAATGADLAIVKQEGAIDDLFELQRSIAACVAEHLRLELGARAGGQAPPEAVERYFAARRSLRSLDYPGVSDAFAGFTRCVELASGYAPAVAARAVAAMRCYYFSTEAGPDWQKIAAESLALALARAPDLPETHLAAGMAATQLGDYASAARSLSLALRLAPACAEANEYLGVLQCEAGAAAEGIARLRFADAQDPSLSLSLAYLGRDHALHGRFDACDAALAELERRHSGFVLVARTMRIRTAVWRGDRDLVRRCSVDPRLMAHRVSAGLLSGARAVLGEISPEDLDRRYAQILAITENPRRATLILQVLTEVHAALGRADAAAAHLLRAAAGTLVDVEWLERCPVLAILRGRPELAEARRRVAARARAIWAG